MSFSTDLVCITFEGDARLVALQILSVDRLLNHDQIGSYIIILNGEDNATLQHEICDATFHRISNALREKILFLGDSDVLCGAEPIGRRNQQLLKLMVARSLTSDHYLLLDAKNHFIRPTALDDFYLDGAPRSVFKKPSAALEPYARASLEVFGKNEDWFVENSLPTTTPYMMIRDQVLDLMARMEDRFEKPFAEAFDADLRATTEFFLYYAHLVSNGKPMPYIDAPSMVVTLFTVWPQDPQMVLRFIHEAQAKNVPLFGLHRLRLPQLRGDQRAAIETMWRSGALLPHESAEWFMEPLVQGC